MREQSRGSRWEEREVKVEKILCQQSYKRSKDILKKIAKQNKLCMYSAVRTCPFAPPVATFRLRS